MCESGYFKTQNNLHGRLYVYSDNISYEFTFIAELDNNRMIKYDQIKCKIQDPRDIYTKNVNSGVVMTFKSKMQGTSKSNYLFKNYWHKYLKGKKFNNF